MPKYSYVYLLQNEAVFAKKRSTSENGISTHTPVKGAIYLYKKGRFFDFISENILINNDLQKRINISKSKNLHFGIFYFRNDGYRRTEPIVHQADHIDFP